MHNKLRGGGDPASYVGGEAIGLLGAHGAKVARLFAKVIGQPVAYAMAAAVVKRVPDPLP